MNYFVKPWVTTGPYVGIAGIPAPSFGIVQRPMPLISPFNPDAGNLVFNNPTVPAPLPTQGSPTPVTAGLSSLPVWAYALGALGLWFAFGRR